jgi:hypothetical protein
MSIKQTKIINNFQTKNITDSSFKLYLNNLKRLNDGGDIKNYNFLKDEKVIMTKIEKYKPNTQRSYIISIVSLLKQEPKQKKLYDVYYKILIDFNKKLKENTEKSEKQIENWITQDEVKKIYDDLHSEVLTTLKPRKCSDYNKLLSFVVLSLYVLNAPRRNKDYQDMLITINYNDEKDKKFNYFDIINKKFYFNNYKTQSTYKCQEIPVSEELYNILTMFLKYHPLNKELKKNDIYLLVDCDGKPLLSNNAITRILNKIFDKKIGSSMLRNIYLTTKYSLSNKEKKEDATAMGNSVGVIDSNYVKTD